MTIYTFIIINNTTNDTDNTTNTTNNNNEDIWNKKCILAPNDSNQLNEIKKKIIVLKNFTNLI